MSLRTPLTLAAGAVAIGALAAARPVLDGVVARTERRHNPTPPEITTDVSDRARDLHATLRVADLHADSLLFGRDLLLRGDRGHVDVPRLIEGHVALQVLSCAMKVPRHINIERNEDASDDVLAIALAKRWPPPTWRSILARALYMAERARGFAERSSGTFRLIETRGDLQRYLAVREADPAITAGLLSIEGATALDGDPANVELVANAGFRMISPAHLTDTVFGGSAHGAVQGGLTRLGHEMVRRMEARGVLLDVAHASAATIDDALAISTRPVVASHTGVKGVHDNARNLTDGQLSRIAATGGLVGIGFWPWACGGPETADIARSIAYAVERIGPDRVALGSDWDGAVPVPFDAAHVDRLTDALLGVGLDERTIRAVMGENVLRLLGETLPRV
jgi:microsomal dipeptidase-like Zn-dependent dipeptidase